MTVKFGSKPKFCQANFGAAEASRPQGNRHRRTVRKRRPKPEFAVAKREC